MDLPTPGSGVRHASVVRHVAGTFFVQLDCAIYVCLSLKATLLCFVSFICFIMSSHIQDLLFLVCTRTGKCIRRFGGIYAYCRYFIDQKW